MYIDAYAELNPLIIYLILVNLKIYCIHDLVNRLKCCIPKIKINCLKAYAPGASEKFHIMLNYRSLINFRRDYQASVPMGGSKGVSAQEMRTERINGITGNIHEI